MAKVLNRRRKRLWKERKMEKIPSADQQRDPKLLQTIQNTKMTIAISYQFKRSQEWTIRPKIILLVQWITCLVWEIRERALLIEAQVVLDVTWIKLAILQPYRLQATKDHRSVLYLTCSRSMVEACLPHSIIQYSHKPCRLQPWPHMKRVD